MCTVSLFWAVEKLPQPLNGLQIALRVVDPPKKGGIQNIGGETSCISMNKAELDLIEPATHENIGAI